MEMNLSGLNSPFSLGKLNDSWMSPYSKINSSNGITTEFALSGFPNLEQCKLNYGLLHYHQSFTDVANPLSHEKAPYFSCEKYAEKNTANPQSMPAQKRFLVFDQSGDQTTMFYAPAIGPPVQLISEVPKPENIYNNNIKFHSNQDHHIFTHAHNEKQRDETESEMREDTEELNALLYSDDDYYEDEEETSTGHSPSTLTDFDRESGENGEEVASNFGPNKRIRLSTIPKFSSECEDDAESSCGDRDNLDSGDYVLKDGKKRTRKDQIRETLSLLQSIIPGGKGKDKDAIFIFDEAIDYLKSLKVKAQALGVHNV